MSDLEVRYGAIAPPFSTPKSQGSSCEKLALNFAIEGPVQRSRDSTYDWGDRALDFCGLSKQSS